MVLGPLLLGMSPILSRANIDTPGMMNVGAERTILEAEV